MLNELYKYFSKRPLLVSNQRASYPPNRIHLTRLDISIKLVSCTAVSSVLLALSTKILVHLFITTMDKAVSTSSQ